MSKNIRTQLNNVIGKSLNGYHSRVKPTIDELHFKEQYQGRIIDCMIGEVDDNYITTPETDASIVKLEHSKEGVVKVPTIKGKTILVDAEGNETDTPGEGCRLVSVGEDSNKIIILSNNSMIDNSNNKFGSIDIDTGIEVIHGKTCVISDYNLIDTDENVILCDINFNILSGTDNYNNVSKRYYDKNKKYLGANKTENAFFVRYRCLTTNNISYNGNATDYIFKTSHSKNILYKSHKTEILLSEPLRSLPNGVYDEIVGNKLIRRIGQRILDEKAAIEILKENPLESFYELAEPIIEELPNSTTLQGFDDATIYIENSITPTVSYEYNALMPYKEEVLSQKRKVESNTLDVENNIIPYLMDMEFNLMLMEDK